MEYVTRTRVEVIGQGMGSVVPFGSLLSYRCVHSEDRPLIRLTCSCLRRVVSAVLVSLTPLGVTTEPVGVVDGPVQETKTQPIAVTRDSASMLLLRKCVTLDRG